MFIPDKPFSQSCEENKDPIRAVLARYLSDADSVLEIGSGTGQHAVAFAAAFPHLTWQCSDLPRNLPGVRLWLAEAALPNTPEPFTLDVTGDWPDARFDAVFSANTAHIMDAPQAEAMMLGVPRVLVPGGVFALYGPFNYGGHFTSDSNERFDRWLKANDPRSGIKDFELLDAAARAGGMSLVHDHEMPANNRTLVWRLQG